MVVAEVQAKGSMIFGVISTGFDFTPCSALCVAVNGVLKMTVCVIPGARYFVIARKARKRENDLRIKLPAIFLCVRHMYSSTHTDTDAARDVRNDGFFSVFSNKFANNRRFALGESQVTV